MNASAFRCTGRGHDLRIGFQFIKGLSADAVERIIVARGGHPERSEGSLRVHTWRDPSVAPLPRDDIGEVPFTSFGDLRARTQLRPDDLRLLVKVGALDSIAGEMTRPMLLWAIDAEAAAHEKAPGAVSVVRGRAVAKRPLTTDTAPGASETAPINLSDLGAVLPAEPPRLREYSTDRRRRAEYELLGFTTDSHPMALYREELARFHVVPTTELHQHVGRTVLAAGMLTTAKPVHTIKDEPMEFATFDDGHGLIEAVLFPRIYHERGHVLFDQGPFIFRGKVEEEFGAVTLTITHLDRLERMLEKVRAPSRRLAPPDEGG